MFWSWVFELLQTHSQHVPSIFRSDSISDSGSAFQCVTLLKLISWILSYHVLSTDTQVLRVTSIFGLQVSLSHNRKLELIKFWRIVIILALVRTNILLSEQIYCYRWRYQRKFWRVAFNALILLWWDNVWNWLGDFQTNELDCRY